MRSIKDLELDFKKVIVRCDFNVPIKDGIINDDSKIKASLDTINYLIEKKCRIILMSHLGKVKEESDLKKNSLYPISVRLSELLGKEVLFSKDTRSDDLTKMCSGLKNGEILLIENTRFEDLNGKKESGCDMDLSTYWASLGEVFINDAYASSHRAHASNYGIAKLLPNAAGFLVEKEVSKIDSILNEDTHPFVVIMGGAKVVDKIKLINNLIEKCDKLLIGGAMSYTFLKALGYNVGASLVDNDAISYCVSVLEKYKDKIVLPVDVVVADKIDVNVLSSNKKILEFLDNDMGLDIGFETIKLFKDELKNAKRVIVNGPMGVFEIDKFANGTKELYQFLSDNNIKTLIGGGDSAFSVNKFGFSSSFYHISTGGGATLEYLEGKGLPGLEVINDEK